MENSLLADPRDIREQNEKLKDLQNRCRRSQVQRRLRHLSLAQVRPARGNPGFGAAARPNRSARRRNQSASDRVEMPEPSEWGATEREVTMENLKDVYIDQLQDLHSANKQALEATRKLASAASDDALRHALERGAEGIKDGCSKLEQLVRAHSADPSGEHCKGMEGLVKEARSHALEEDFGQGAVRDAVIITQYQRMAHYAIAGYGCTAAFAKQLGLTDEADKLSEMLNAAYSGDKTMTEIAEGAVNQRAV